MNKHDQSFQKGIQQTTLTHQMQMADPQDLGRDKG